MTAIVSWQQGEVNSNKSVSLSSGSEKIVRQNNFKMAAAPR